LVAPLLTFGAEGPKKITTVEGITEYQYDNGLRVLLFPDPSKPTVTVNITYFVGSRHEGLGETGMAHLLEHMVFKGTPTYENIWGALEDHGANFNGTTWTDRTNYFETLPAGDEQLEFALKMEADRMINSFIRKSDLDSEFSVVRNEFEMGENNPMNILSQRMTAAAYEWHNYGKSTIGSRSDIERVPIENLQAFYRKFYQPDNAMLVVAGKFEVEKCLGLITRYFGSLPRPDRILPNTYTLEPVQDGERHVVLRRNGDVHAIGAVYHICAGAHEDFAAVEALMDVLVYKPAGRLYKALVESGLAANVFGSGYGFAEPGVVEFMAEVRLEQPPQPVLEKMTKVIEEFKAQPVTKEETERAKAHLLKNIELNLTRSDRIGVELSEWAAMGDWRLFFIHRDRIKKLEPADLQRVAERYLLTSNRTTGVFLPTKDPERSEIPETPAVAALVKDYKGSQEIAVGEDFEATPENIEKRTKRVTLPGGMRLALLSKATRGDAVRARLVLHYGTESELKGKTTALSMVPDMLMRGTTKRSYQQIRDDLDRLKARVSMGGRGFGGGSVGTISATIETTRENVVEVLKLVAEILMEPAFPPAEFEIIQREALAAMEQQLSDPQALGFTTLLRKLQPWEPDNVRYVPTVQESIDRTRAVTLDEIKGGYRKFYGASHAELAMVGDFDEQAVQRTLEETLGRWKSPTSFERIVTPYRGDVKASLDVVHTPDKKMSVVGAGLNIEMRDDDAEYPALYIANYVLGSSAKSRLLNRLRHKGGLSYGAGSMFQADDQDRRAVLVGFAICAAENTDKAYDALLEEISKWTQEGLTDEELSEAKNSYSLQMKNDFANDSYVASTLADCLWTGRTLDYFSKLEKSIQAAAGDQIKKVIPKYVDPARLVKVKAGDVKPEGKETKPEDRPGS
jgi:zinc protease